MFVFATVAVLAAATASPAATDRNVQASYDTARDRYCLRMTREDPTMPSGLHLYQRSCRSKQQWARDGVTIQHRAPDQG